LSVFTAIPIFSKNIMDMMNSVGFIVRFTLVLLFALLALHSPLFALLALHSTCSVTV
jgi:hypothetical protein